MRQVKSCGILVFRRQPELAFLLMRHPDRLDLPKGHLRKRETEVECAFRELEEETGLSQTDVQFQEGFRFVTTYYPRYERYGGEVVEKQVVLFLAYLLQPREIRVSEHGGHEWVPWQPPHHIQRGTIDEILEAVERFFAQEAAKQTDRK
jgi:8-oxo-dGTP pyrophosphatase MutT (NUDIX family)